MSAPTQKVSGSETGARYAAEDNQPLAGAHLTTLRHRCQETLNTYLSAILLSDQLDNFTERQYSSNTG